MVLIVFSALALLVLRFTINLRRTGFTGQGRN
jgi:hypothetical protein